MVRMVFNYTESMAVGFLLHIKRGKRKEKAIASIFINGRWVSRGPPGCHLSLVASRDLHPILPPALYIRHLRFLTMFIDIASSTIFLLRNKRKKEGICFHIHVVAPNDI